MKQDYKIPIWQVPEVSEETRKNGTPVLNDDGTLRLTNHINFLDYLHGDTMYWFGQRIPIVHIPRQPMRLNVEITGYERGRSAAHLTWKASFHGSLYEGHPEGDYVLNGIMFLTDFMEVYAEMVGGVIPGEWRMGKRGQNYGIRRC